MWKSVLLLSVAISNVAKGAPSLQKRVPCACGYRDSNGAVWRESFESDFTIPAGPNVHLARDWDISTWGEQRQYAYIQYTSSNVFPYQDAIGLKTSADDQSGTTRTAEIVSKRDDILYGTFRMRAQVPSVAGVCFGFFTYHDNTNEADIEFLSSDPLYWQRVYYTNQPSLDSNGNIDPNAHQAVDITGADFTFFRNHRFDWLPTQTKFYYEGTLQATLTNNVPNVGSYLMANVWSDANPGWSKGPPASDAIATIQHIKAYFNSTSFSEEDFNTQCDNEGNPAVCDI